MCTVLLRFVPSADWPLLLAAVRDEFVDRSWDPPAAHWAAQPGLLGGRDRAAGGTWLAVRPDRPAVAAILNGVRRPPLPAGIRPTRGRLPLDALAGDLVTAAGDLTIDPTDYDGFHLVVGTPEAVRVWSWDAVTLTRRDLTPGDHIIVNLGVDDPADPTVPHFAPLLAATGIPSLPPPPSTADTATAWGEWVDLLRGDNLAPDDERALLMRVTVEGRTYGSTSLSLVAVGRDHVRYDFAATPLTPQWTTIR